MGQTFENDLHLEKWVTLENMGKSTKNGSHLDLTRKNEPYLEKQDALRKMSHI